MNIYADRGNLLLLERRCEWRGIGFEFAGAGLGDALDPDAPTSTTSAAARTATRSSARRTSPSASATTCMRPPPAARRSSRSAAATSCSATPMSWATRRCPAWAWSTCTRCASDGARLIGNVAIEVDLPGPAGGPRVLAGFENHGGRTYLGDGRAARARPAAATATTEATDTRASARATSSAPTCTGRCCPRTRGSRTG